MRGEQSIRGYWCDSHLAFLEDTHTCRVSFTDTLVKQSRV